MPLPLPLPLQRWFYCHSSILLGRVFEMYCARLGICLGAVKFMLRGERAFGAATPDSLKVGAPAGGRAAGRRVGCRAVRQVQGCAGLLAMACKCVIVAASPASLAPACPCPACPAPPAPLQMREGEELTAVPESTDRLQQARELGPLFTAVFGSAATAGLAKLPELL